MPDISRLQREYGRYNLTHTVTYRERTDVYNEESLKMLILPMRILQSG